jgi:signal transduction histidine kinase
MLIALLMGSLFVTLGLGVSVLVKAPHRRVNRTFAAFLGMMILWIVKDLFFWGFREPNQEIRGWVQSSFLIGLGLQYVFLLFTEVFPEDTPPRWRWLGGLAIPLLILVPWVVWGSLWSSLHFNADGGFTIEVTWQAWVFGGWNYLLLLLGIWELVRKRRQYLGTLQGMQIQFVLLSVILTGSLLFLVANVLPLLGYYQGLPYTSLIILMGALIYGYAISNFQLFSLQTALDQLRLFPLSYKVAIAVASTGVLGFLIVQVPVAIWVLGGEREEWIRFIVFSTISGMIPSLVLVLVIVRILSRPLRELTELALSVSQGNYGAETEMVSNDELGVLASSFNVMSRKMAGDIAQLKEMNQALIQTEKLAVVGTMATSIAHEVNNPLASISSLVQSLMREEGEGAKLEKLRLMLGQVNRISRVSRDLMELARPKRPQWRATDLNQLIRKSLELAGYDKRFRRLTITTELEPVLPLLMLDPDRVQQVLLNLLLNARDAIAEEREDGQLLVRSRFDGEGVAIRIDDNGSGIPPEILPVIFDPFFTTKGRGQGTGLGLAVCLNLVTAMGGTITASNREPGSSFLIRFPGTVGTPSDLPTTIRRKETA